MAYSNSSLWKVHGIVFLLFFFRNFTKCWLINNPRTGRLLETIEKQKTILSDKEKKLTACEKARKASEGLVKDLLEKVCIDFISMMSWKVLALLFTNLDSTEE